MKTPPDADYNGPAFSRSFYALNGFFFGVLVGAAVVVVTVTQTVNSLGTELDTSIRRVLQCEHLNK